MEFIKLLFKLCFKIVVCAIVFTGLVWFLLGIKPIETWQRFTQNVNQIASSLSGTASTTTQTVSDIKNVAEYVSDRIEGKDPYENFAKKLDAHVQQRMK